MEGLQPRYLDGAGRINKVERICDIAAGFDQRWVIACADEEHRVHIIIVTPRSSAMDVAVKMGDMRIISAYQAERK